MCTYRFNSFDFFCYRFGQAVSSDASPVTALHKHLSHMLTLYKVREEPPIRSIDIAAVGNDDAAKLSCA